MKMPLARDRDNDASIHAASAHHLEHEIDGDITALINRIFLCLKREPAIHKDCRALSIAA